MWNRNESINEKGRTSSKKKWCIKKVKKRALKVCVFCVLLYKVRGYSRGLRMRTMWHAVICNVESEFPFQNFISVGIVSDWWNSRNSVCRFFPIFWGRFFSVGTSMSGLCKWTVSIFRQSNGVATLVEKAKLRCHEMWSLNFKIPFPSYPGGI